MGALKIVRHASGPHYKIGSPGQPFTMTETYLVSWIPVNAEDVQTLPEDIAIIVEASENGVGGLKIPKVQQRYTGCDANASFLVCESVDWRVMPGALKTWTVTANWSSIQEFQYNSTVPEPWTRITRTSSMRQMPIWRRDAAIPAEPYTFPPALAGGDIGGTKVDVQGQPANRFVQQMQIICEFHYDRTFTLGPSGAISPEPGPYFSGWLGTRNSVAFLGYDAGQILCNGISVSPVNDQIYIMQFKFLFDWMSFFEQRPAPNTGGAPFLVAAATTFLGVPYNQASKIAWYQPYQDREDLKLMFPEAVYNAFLTALPPVNTCATPGRSLASKQFNFDT
jgi:hypothetical protein